MSLNKETSGVCYRFASSDQILVCAQPSSPSTIDFAHKPQISEDRHQLVSSFGSSLNGSEAAISLPWWQNALMQAQFGLVWEDSRIAMMSLRLHSRISQTAASPQ